MKEIYFVSYYLLFLFFFLLLLLASFEKGKMSFLNKYRRFHFSHLKVQ